MKMWPQQQLFFTALSSSKSVVKQVLLLCCEGEPCSRGICVLVANLRQGMKDANRVGDFGVYLFWYIDFCCAVEQGQAYEVVFLALV